MPYTSLHVQEEVVAPCWPSSDLLACLFRKSALSQLASTKRSYEFLDTRARAHGPEVRSCPRSCFPSGSTQKPHTRWSWVICRLSRSVPGSTQTIPLHLRHVALPHLPILHPQDSFTCTSWLRPQGQEVEILCEARSADKEFAFCTVATRNADKAI